VADKDSGCLRMLAGVSIIVDTARWCLGMQADLSIGDSGCLGMLADVSIWPVGA
jgi:hypothetical protein